MDTIDQIRKDIEDFQKESENVNLRTSKEKRKSEEILLNRIFYEEEKPSNKGAIITISLIMFGLLFGGLCGVLGFIQVFKWFLEIVKAIL